MLWKKVAIGVRGQGSREVCGELAYCPTCKGEVWLLFVAAGQSHPHCQCAGCGEVFCSQERECSDETWTPEPYAEES